MIEFIKDIGGWWEFAKGLFYIVLIITSVTVMIDIIKDLVLYNDRPLD